MPQRTVRNPQQTSRTGEHFVAAEIHKRDGYAVTFARNMPKIDILASDAAQGRTANIQVKAKSSTSKGWQTRTTLEKERESDAS